MKQLWPTVYMRRIVTIVIAFTQAIAFDSAKLKK